METDAAAENGHDFRVRCHLRREENHRNEHEQRREHVHEIRNEIHIIIENDGLERSFLRDKVVNFLTDVENDDDADNEHYRDKEGQYELLEYIDIQFLWSQRKFHRRGIP